MQGRCMKCREQKDMKAIKITQTKRGGYMAKGICPKCNTSICKILSKDNAEKAIQEGIAEKAF